MGTFADELVKYIEEQVDKIGVGQEGYEAIDKGLDEEEEEEEDVAGEEDVDDVVAVEEEDENEGLDEHVAVERSHHSREEEEGEGSRDAIAKSNYQAGKFIVRLRNYWGEAEKFTAELRALIKKQKAANKVVVFEDFDISRTSFATNALKRILSTLVNENVHVERLRAFRITTLDDEVCSALASWLQTVSYTNTPFEIHLSDCAISNKGFQCIMEALEHNDAFPSFDSRFSSKVPMYLRLENNYIDPDMIQEKVDSGVLTTTHKRDHSHNNDWARARLLIRKCRGKVDYKQIKGKPPKPQDAPLAKHTENIYLGRKANKGKSKGKSGKAKTSKGSAQAALAAPRQQTRVVAENPWIGSSWSDIREADYSKDKRPHREYDSDNRNHRSRSRNRQPQQPQQHGDDRTSHRTQTRPSKRCPAPRESDVSKRPHSEHANRSDCDGGKQLQPRAASSEAPTQQTPCSANAPTSKRPQPSSKPSTATNSKAKHSLPAPWEEHWSEEHSSSYFWNADSGASTWWRPSRPSCASEVKL